MSKSKLIRSVIIGALILAFASIIFYSLEYPNDMIRLEKITREEKDEILARAKQRYEKINHATKEKINHATKGDNSPIINSSSASGYIVVEYPSNHHSCSSYASPNGAITTCSNHVDKEVAKLKKANIAFNSPSSMKKNETYLINLHLSPNKSTQELLDKIKEDEKEATEIKYSYRMKALLLSENKKAFEIMPISPDVQAVSGILDTTTWKWDVTPLEAGKQYLHLSLIAFLDIEAKETPLQIKTFDKEIEVKVSILDEITSFFQNSWKWLLGSLLFPLIVLYWKLKAEKKS